MGRKHLPSGFVLGAGASTTQWPTMAGAMLSATLIGQLGISGVERSAGRSQSTRARSRERGCRRRPS